MNKKYIVIALTSIFLLLAATFLSLNTARSNKPIFISTDPARDSPSAHKTFIDRFDPTSIGFTSSLSGLQSVWMDYRVMVLYGGDTHSIRVCLVDPEGNWRLTFAPASNPQEIVDDIKLL